MEENTNKRIAINSLFLYAKMFISTICALLTTRFALQALGVVDFGLYSVLGGIISFIGIFNTIMLSTSNRFLAVSVGKGDVNETNKVFNVNLIIFCAIAFLMLIVCYPIGDWYVHNYINYEGDISNAMMVFSISVVGAIVSTIGTPYNGLLIAKENFFLFCLTDVLSHIVRLIVAYMLIYSFDNKLFIYTLTMCIMTVSAPVVYAITCRHLYYDIVKWKFVRDKTYYKDVFKFSAWVSIGAVATIGKNQGAALLVNSFFSTAMNAALGLANNVMSYIQLFANNVVQPISPQITKAYASGNKKRTDELLIMSTKFSFLMMFVVSFPFLVEAEWIMQLWLGKVPDYLVIFLVLLIVDNLVLSMNSGIGNVIFASGKVALYQLSISLLNVLSIVIGYIVLSGGFSSYSLLVVYIAISIIKLFVVQWCLHITLNYDVNLLLRGSYIPSLLVVLLSLPVLLIKPSIHPIIIISYSVAYSLILVFFIGMSKKERIMIESFIKSKINKKYEAID